MFIPIWMILLIGLFVVILIAWTILLAAGRNPLPFPDRGSRIFSASSGEGKDAVVELLALYGIKERFRQTREECGVR